MSRLNTVPSLCCYGLIGGKLADVPVHVRILVALIVLNLIRTLFLLMECIVCSVN